MVKLYYNQYCRCCLFNPSCNPSTQLVFILIWSFVKLPLLWSSIITFLSPVGADMSPRSSGAILITKSSTHFTWGLVCYLPDFLQARQTSTCLTMAQFAAFILTLLHICSSLLLLPQSSIMGTNAALVARKLQSPLVQKWLVVRLLGRHLQKQQNTTTQRRHVPKKHIRKKPIPPTSTGREVLVASKH